VLCSVRLRVPCRSRRARGLLRAPRAGTRAVCWVRRLQAADAPRVPPGAVYDITNTPNSHANEAIKTLNRFTRDTFGLGGIFHGAVEIGGEGTQHGRLLLWALQPECCSCCPERLRLCNSWRSRTLPPLPCAQSGLLVTALTAQECVSSPSTLHLLLTNLGFAGVQLHSEGQPKLHVPRKHSAGGHVHQHAAGATAAAGLDATRVLTPRALIVPPLH
jgi:hypothetical protein